MLELRDLLSYAFGGQVPQGFLEHLLRNRDCWDDEFKRHLDDLAYEFRPDLAVWELTVTDAGVLTERRLSPSVDDLPGPD